jgi:Integrase core domain.
MKLAVNSIIEDVATRKRFRVLQISKNVIDVIAMGTPYKLPESVQTEEVEGYLLTDVYKICEEEDPGHYLGGLTEKQKENIDSIWEIIEKFVLDPETCFDAEKRNIFIKETVQRTGYSRSTVQRWLHRYWAGGSTKMALVPRFTERGGVGAERNEKKKAGHPQTYNTGIQGLRIGEKQKKQVRHIIKTLYNKNDKTSMKYAYEAFLNAYYFDDQAKKLSEAYPTLRQFRYHANKYLNMRTRIGEKKFDRNCRAITGNSATEAEGPGEKYQIDATVADVYLVSRTDRNLIVGRPVLYFVTDVFSRMITGFYVSLEGPSWVDAMMALYYTNMDKVELCKQFDIDIEEDEWPCCGLPQQLLTDNGELVSKASNQLVSELGIHMQNTSAWRPDMKAIVEQSFHLHNSKTRMMLPGSIQPDFGERGAPDYKLDATLNLREFTRMVLRYILKYNRHTLTREPQKAEDVQMDHVRAIPLELWNWGITHRSGCLTKKTSQEVAYALLPRSMARVTERGIKYKSLYYRYRRWKVRKRLCWTSAVEL